MKKLSFVFAIISVLLTVDVNTGAWADKNQAPIIESVQSSIVTLSNGAELRLRPTLYYIVGWDSSSDVNNYGLFRKDFKSVKQIFNLPRDKSLCSFTKQVFHIDFVKGQPCQIILPPVFYDRHYYPWKKDYYTQIEYKQEFNEREKTTQWCWDYTHETIPLNFFDTSTIQQPLRATLYEHPHDEKFYIDYWPNSTTFAFTSNAHVIEADLLQFYDTLETIEANYCKFLDSQIHAKITNDSVLQTWKIGDQIHCKYSKSGIYSVENLSNGTTIEATLSDPGYSDLRNYGFELEKPKKKKKSSFTSFVKNLFSN